MPATATLATGSAGTRADATVDWLLAADHAAIQRLARLRLLRQSPDDPEVAALESRLSRDPWIAALLEGEWRAGIPGGRRVHAYKKWGGAHWRLIALAELGVRLATPGAGPAILDAFDETATWLLSASRVRRANRRVRDRARICGSQDGAAVWAASRLGLASDPRVATLVEHLIAWQWPDGGWNCDVRPEATHASFNESWMALRGLAAYRRTAPDDAGRDGVNRARVETTTDRAAEFLLRHRVVESERTRDLAHPKMAELHWPPFWHYGLLPGLLALQEAGRLGGRRVAPALERLRALRGADGRWHPGGRLWRPPGAAGANVEIVDWTAEGETAMLTVQALQLLGSEGRRQES